MALPSSQKDRRWKVTSIRAYHDPAVSEDGTLDVFTVKNHRTIRLDAQGGVIGNSLMPVSYGRSSLPIPKILCMMHCIFMSTILKFFYDKVGMDHTAAHSLLCKIIDARLGVVTSHDKKGFRVEVDLELTTFAVSLDEGEGEDGPQPPPPRGASEAAIRKLDAESRLPEVFEERGDPNLAGTCGICDEDLWRGLDSNPLLAQMPCSHIFHNPCLLSWLKTSVACPRCRRELDD